MTHKTKDALVGFGCASLLILAIIFFFGCYTQFQTLSTKTTVTQDETILNTATNETTYTHETHIYDMPFYQVEQYRWENDYWYWNYPHYYYYYQPCVFGWQDWYYYPHWYRPAFFIGFHWNLWGWGYGHHYHDYWHPQHNYALNTLHTRTIGLTRGSPVITPRVTPRISTGRTGRAYIPQRTSPFRSYNPPSRTGGCSFTPPSGGGSRGNIGHRAGGSSRGGSSGGSRGVSGGRHR